MTRKPRIHFDATSTGNVARQALCGFVAVETTSDKTAVTCTVCRRQMGEAGSKAKRGPMRERDLQQLLVEAFRAAPLAPSAGPPPRLNAPLWEASCRGGEHRRCGTCVICVWEREAEKYHFASAWRRTHAARRPAGAPAWPSMSAALLDWVDWQGRGRNAPSAMGFMLDRLRAGTHSDGGASRPEDPMLRRAAEMVRVGQVLDNAYPEAGVLVHNAEGATALLPRAQCIQVLLDRTEGARPTLPTYEGLSADFGLAGFAVTVGDLKAVVRTGRRCVTVELAARGLIPMPKSSLGLAELVETAMAKVSEVVPW